MKIYHRFFVVSFCFLALSLASAKVYSYTITASVEGVGGAISPSGAVSVPAGSDQTFTVGPADALQDVSIDGGSVGPQTSYTFSRVAADHTITASFACPTATPPVRLDTNGSFYNSIMAAYDDAVVNGQNNITLDVMAGTLPPEDLYFDSDVAVMLNGGFDCSFNTPPTMTTAIPGSLTIAAGQVIPSNVTLLSSGGGQGTCSTDADNDGYTAIGSCAGSADDCNDQDASVHPGAAEFWGDFVDQNCDGRYIAYSTRPSSDAHCLTCHTADEVNGGHQNVYTPDGTCITCHSWVTRSLLDGHYEQTVTTAENNMAVGEVIHCTSCHDGGTVWAKVTAVGIGHETCDTCHENRAAIHDEAHGNRVIDPTCAQCHTSDTSVLGQPGSGKLQSQADVNTLHRNDCALCHAYTGSLLNQQTVSDAIQAGMNGSQITCTTCHTLAHTSGKHIVHLSINGIHCSTCHNTGQIPYFKSGTDTNGDGLYDLNETDVCYACHHDGAGNPADPSFKNDWLTEGYTLACNSCHSYPPSYPNGSPKANSHQAHSGFTCNNCHSATTADGQTISNPANHGNGVYDLQAGNGVSFVYAYDAAGGHCSSISCHGNTSAQWGNDASATCLACHSIAQGNRSAITPQFSANSHHVQGVTISTTQCYQCHWEANADGTVNTIYHGGPTKPGSTVDLVIYGAGARPTTYTVGTTAIQYLADGSRAEFTKLNMHCLGCHSDQNNSTQPFGDGKTPNSYAWDGTCSDAAYNGNQAGCIANSGTWTNGTSIDARYSQTGTTPWGKYSGVNVTPKDTQTKAFSAHGNATANQEGWDLSEGWPNTTGSVNVVCFDCHNAHGSSVAGRTTSYDDNPDHPTTNGGILKDTTLASDGYSVAYKPVAGGSVAEKDSRNAGASLCFDCHLGADSGTSQPWGYQSTFGASASILGYWDSPYFGPGTFGPQERYPYKADTPDLGGHFGASSALSTTPQGTINGLCTPCHDPHGVSPTLGNNEQYAVPLLKGTWVTSPYKEDAAPADNTQETINDINGGNVFHIDQNTFGTGLNSTLTAADGVQQTDSQFAGLCLRCHPKNSLTDGSNGGTWKSVDRIHESVKGWGANTEHKYICSKCHAPHDSRLPRLLVTDCWDTKHKGRVGYNPSPVLSGSDSCRYEDPTYGCTGNGSGHGSFPGNGSGGGVGWEGSNSFNSSVSCHENLSTDESWNNVSNWAICTVSIAGAPTAGSYITATDGKAQATISWQTSGSCPGDSYVYYGLNASYEWTAGYSGVVAGTHSVVLTGLDNHTTYYYKVSSGNTASQDESGGYSFTVLAPPAIPTLTAEADSLCTTSSCDIPLTWNAVDNLDGEPVSYQVQVDTSASFNSANLQTSAWSSATSWTPNLATNNNWYWRVRSREDNYSTVTSAWSAPDVFNMWDGLTRTITVPLGHLTMVTVGDYTGVNSLTQGQSGILWAGPFEDNGNCATDRLFLNFDTSTLGTAATISSAKLYLDYQDNTYLGGNAVTEVHDSNWTWTSPAPDMNTFNDVGALLASQTVTSGGVGNKIAFDIPAANINATGETKFALKNNIENTCSNLDPGYQNATSYLEVTFKADPGWVNPPSVPVLIAAPDVADCGVSACPTTLEWNASTDPDGDQVQYYAEADDNPSFSNANGRQQTLNWQSGTSWTVSLERGIRWYWRVKATDSFHETAWSSTDDFLIDGPLPAPAPVAEPNAGTTGANLSVQLQWQGTITPDGSAPEYEVEVDDDPAFGSVDYTSGWITTTDWTTTLPAGSWYWRVMARHAVNTSLESDWSAADHFFIVAAPTLVDEPDISDCSTATCSVTLDWSTITAPAGYQSEYYVQIDDHPTFGSIDYNSGWITSNSFTLDLPNNTTWYWRVKTRYYSVAENGVSGYSASDSFVLWDGITQTATIPLTHSTMVTVGDYSGVGSPLSEGQSGILWVGPFYDTDGCALDHSFLNFDTSSLGAGATVSSAKLYLDYQNNNYLQNGDAVTEVHASTWTWTSPAPDMNTFDNVGALLASKTVRRADVGTMIVFDIPTANINPGGETKFALINNPDTNNCMNIDPGYQNATSYLEVIYKP